MNTRSTLQLTAALIVLAAAFFVGRGSRWLEAQGRGGPPERPLTPGDRVELSRAEPEVLVYGEENGVASASNGILAVTGSYGVGTSVLYVIDTINRQLAVYEARGGSSSMRRVTLVGARRIDLDLQLEGYNDESEFQYAALRKRFGDLEAGGEGGRPDAAKGPSSSGR